MTSDIKQEPVSPGLVPLTCSGGVDSACMGLSEQADVRGRRPASGPDSPASKIVVIIVGYYNAGDVVCCLRALAKARCEPVFDIFVAENGGPVGAAALLAALSDDWQLCSPIRVPDAVRGCAAEGTIYSFVLAARTCATETRVHVLQMTDNLGYAGAVNACLRPLLRTDDWHAAWILNPDTEPAPSALFELAVYADKHGKGMVGSKIAPQPSTPPVSNCGLRWSRLSARTVSIQSDTLEGRGDDLPLDAPSGASVLVTRALLERIGLMDERYFLFFEDLEWGYRAKQLGQVGFAEKSVVWHQGGTTLGSFGTRKTRSQLSVYLDFRNRILFVRDKHKPWLVWTAFMQLVHLATFIPSGSFSNLIAGGLGLLAGIRGEIGRPDDLVSKHRAG